MKKIVVIMVALAFLFAGCGTKSTPEKTVAGFLDAYNDADYDGMIDYLEPSEAQAVRALLKLSGDASGVDIASLVKLGPLVKNENMLDYEIVDTQMDDEYAKVKVQFSDLDEVKFKLKLIDNTWYLLVQ